MLAGFPGVRAAPEARDPLGREGEAVAVPVRHGGGDLVTVMFDPRTTDLRFWEQTGAGRELRRLVVRTGHVSGLGERP